MRSIEVPKEPQEVLVRPDGQVAYVSCHESMKVAAINLQTWKVDQDHRRRSLPTAWHGPKRPLSHHIIGSLSH